MTGARGELLATGRLGPMGAALLYETVGAVAHARNFKPPDGHIKWDRSAIEGVAHEVVAGPRGVKRLTDLLIRSTDEESFERQLHGAVLNVLRDLGRRTDMGALVRRVTEVLTDSAAFRPVGAAGQRRWTLADGADAPSQISERVLMTAANGVRDISVPRWNSAKRRSPQADFDSFERLLAAILTAAQGSVRAADLAKACLARLDPAHVPLVVSLDVLEYTPDSLDSETEDQTLNRVVAHQQVDALSDRERLLLATMDRTVREAAAALSMGHSHCGALRRQLTTHLTRLLGADPDGEAIMREMLRYAQEWMSNRTEGQGATS